MVEIDAHHAQIVQGRKEVIRAARERMEAAGIEDAAVRVAEVLYSFDCGNLQKIERRVRELLAVMVR